MTGPSAETRAASIALRAARAAVLRQLGSGDLQLDALLTADAHVEQRETLAKVPVQRVLRAVTGFGPHTIMRVCRAAEVDRLTQVAALSLARRQSLADAAAAEVDLTSYVGRGPRRKAAS